jgi:hypothetical protein
MRRAPRAVGQERGLKRARRDRRLFVAERLSTKPRRRETNAGGEPETDELRQRLGCGEQLEHAWLFHRPAAERECVECERARAGRVFGDETPERRFHRGPLGEPQARADTLERRRRRERSGERIECRGRAGHECQPHGGERFARLLRLEPLCGRRPALVPREQQPVEVRDQALLEEIEVRRDIRVAIERVAPQVVEKRRVGRVFFKDVTPAHVVSVLPDRAALHGRVAVVLHGDLFRLDRDVAVREISASPASRMIFVASIVTSEPLISTFAPLNDAAPLDLELEVGRGLLLEKRGREAADLPPSP